MIIQSLLPIYLSSNLQTNTKDDLDNIEIDLLEEANCDSKKILSSEIRKYTTYREMFFQEVKLPIN